VGIQLNAPNSDNRTPPQSAESHSVVCTEAAPHLWMRPGLRSCVRRRPPACRRLLWLEILVSAAKPFTPTSALTSEGFSDEAAMPAAEGVGRLRGISVPGV